jgi:oxygen-independent coproporphyrinogen III oxidase
LAGIYIHIPFCRKACHYCDFHFSTTLESMDAMIAAISREMALTSDFLGGQLIHTVYFGGGTPSLLPRRQLEALLERLTSVHAFAEGAEITLEANPDDMDPLRVAEWKSAGINRLSIGVQSFRDQELTWMNRAHTAAQASHSIRMARDLGFERDSIDLIYGIPGLHDEDLRHNLQTAIALGCPHLSCYALTVESRTPLAHSISLGKTVPIDSEQQARQFLLVIDELTKAGYEHYEISNFALPGHRSRHNSSYWKGDPYLGLGPSAHSFDGRIRRWNVSNNATYIRMISEDTLPFEEEVLTPMQQLNESIMTSIRTSEGLDLTMIRDRWGKAAAEQLARSSETYRIRQWTTQDDGRIVLTNAGKLFADGIAADLFFERMP